MKKIILSLSILCLAVTGAHAQKKAQIKETGEGTQIGTGTNQNLGFYGQPPITQPVSPAQAALATTAASGTFGFSGNPTPMVFASGLLTVLVNPTAADTITLGSLTYNYVTAISGTTTNQIVIGPTVAATIQNTLGAINYWTSAGQVPGATYYIANGGTTANSSALAVTGTAADTIQAFAITTGSAGNAIASTSSFTSGSNSWGASTLTGGAQGGTITIGSTTYTFSAFPRNTIANLVLVGGTLPVTLQNLVDAVDGANPGLGEYSTATSYNVVAGASLTTGTSITANALLSGTLGNTISGTANVASSGTLISASTGKFTGGAQFTDTNAMANLINELRAELAKEGLIHGGQ